MSGQTDTRNAESQKKWIRALAVIVGFLGIYMIASDTAKAEAKDLAAAAVYVEHLGDPQIKSQFDAMVANKWPSSSELKRFLPQKD